jgi:hypothetical protein
MKNLDIDIDDRGACNRCGSTDETIYGKRNYSKNDNPDSWQWWCRACAKRFNVKSSKDMRGRVWSGMWPARCKICNKDLRWKRTFHFGRMIPNGAWQFCCEICLCMHSQRFWTQTIETYKCKTLKRCSTTIDLTLNDHFEIAVRRKKRKDAGIKKGKRTKKIKTYERKAI